MRCPVQIQCLAKSHSEHFLHTRKSNWQREGTGPKSGYTAGGVRRANVHTWHSWVPGVSLSRGITHGDGVSKVP